MLQLLVRIEVQNVILLIYVIVLSQIFQIATLGFVIPVKLFQLLMRLQNKIV